MLAGRKLQSGWMTNSPADVCLYISLALAGAVVLVILPSSSLALWPCLMIPPKVLPLKCCGNMRMHNPSCSFVPPRIASAAAAAASLETTHTPSQQSTVIRYCFIMITWLITGKGASCLHFFLFFLLYASHRAWVDPGTSILRSRQY